MAYQKDLKELLKFINRAKKLEPFSCPNNTNNTGAIGIMIEKKLILNVHKENKSDMPMLELKTKNIKSKGTLSLAKYTNPSNTFIRTFNKVKYNLMLIYYNKIKHKIYPIKIELYSKLNKSLFAIYCKEDRRKDYINCTISTNKLKTVYNNMITINQGET